MRIIASNSAAGGCRSLLLLLLLFVTDHFWTSLGSSDSHPIKKKSKYHRVHPDHQGFLLDVDAQRENTSNSIMDFEFNLNRVRVISDAHDIPKVKSGVVYWMNRDHRVHDNWALLYAQKLAIQIRVALHIVYCSPSVVVDTLSRQFQFMSLGLKKVELECQLLNIEFNFLIGDSTKTLSKFVKNRNVAIIVVDFSPLRDDINKLDQLVRAIGSETPIVQVDAHNIVPCWILAERDLSDTFPVTRLRESINEKLDPYLTEFPPVIRHPYTPYPKSRSTDWKMVFSKIQIDNDNLKELRKMKTGYIPAMSSLNNFIQKKLSKYHKTRCNPLEDGCSNLSPWLHFGHISAQRVLLEVMKFNDTCPTSVRVFKEGIFLRRELYDNYCYYNSKYDSIEGGPAWGRETLDKHRNDTRHYVYTREEFEKSQTTDLLWNGVQNQLIKEGMVHRFLRPYWAKKILEFSKTPEEAIATANYLNNKYSLDGNDPAGYGGNSWSITGLYDQDVAERKIFGKIRYISSIKINSKFNAYAYVRKYNADIKDEQIGSFAPP